MPDSLLLQMIYHIQNYTGTGGPTH